MSGSVATIEIVDDGPGIPVADQARVLDRFYRASNTTGQASGLGLAIAVKIATAHHAALTVSNRSGGRGLIVFVRGFYCLPEARNFD